MTAPEANWRLRYSRHLALPEFGEAAQRRLADGSALVIGLGGLGSPAALYLACAGIGRLILNDFDRVDASNLPRQILYGEDQIGLTKTEAAAATLRTHNPSCILERLEGRLDEAALLQAASSVDVVLDGSDNFGTRFAVNAACVRARRPLVSGAAVRYEGQLTVFDPREAASPCYACLYGEGDEQLEDCQRNGILSPVTGILGSLMATEAIKILTGVGRPLIGHLLQFDALSGEMRYTTVLRDPGCPVCGKA